MVRLSIGVGEYFDLDRHWIPESMFDYGIASDYHRGEDTDATQFYSDKLPEAKPMVFRTNRHFDNTAELKAYVENVTANLKLVTFVWYFNLGRSIEAAVLNWNFGAEGMTYLEATIILYPSSAWIESMF